jgi:hypothetical protein
MSFGKSVFLAGFIQKTVQVDLIARINHVYPWQKQLQKTLEDTRRQPSMTDPKRMISGAGWPHLQVGLLVPPVMLRFDVGSSTAIGSNLHRCFKLVWSEGLELMAPLYIAAPTLLPEAILKP